MKEKNVKVTTTTGFDDIKIIEYLEPITAHVVVGMNFFKDFLSGFTDFFGGKSSSYQDTLSSINEEVINKLRKKAYSIGANCVVGLKIDNDEISAQGKSMMMVTAMGTAARANFKSESTDLKTDKKLKSIDIKFLNLLNLKRQYLERFKNNELKIDEKFWEFIKTNKVHELSKFVIDEFENALNTWQEFEREKLNKLKTNTLEYFSIINSEFASKELYNKLKEEELSELARENIIKITIGTNLIDYNQIIQLLKHSNFNVQKSGVQIANFDKETYDKQDINQINEVLELITTIFNKRGEITTKKKLLSSKDLNIWICECQKENKEENIHCLKCGKDIFGFTENEKKPKEVIELLTNKIQLLRQVLG